MRESIGGTWLTGIVITFLALFAGFLVYSINYTKAFRLKNSIIEIIEKKEGYTMDPGNDIKNLSDDDLLSNGTAEAEIYRYIRNLGYNNSAIKECPFDKFGTSVYGFCLEKHCINANNLNKVYYKVTTYISLTIPIVNVSVNIPISGETTTMYHDITGMINTVSDHNCLD